jgi:hypothetical protein
MASSQKANNLDAVITKVTYTFQDDNTIQTIYWVKITKDGEIFATGKTVSAEKQVRTELGRGTARSSAQRNELLATPRLSVPEGP